jgi:hypothetical protein
MNYRKFPALLLLTALSCMVQQPSTSAKAQAKPTTKTETLTVAAPDLDVQALIKETEQVDMRRGKIGIFWWVPPDYWSTVLRQQGYTSEEAIKAFEPFRKYNLFMIAVGDMEGGSATWMNEPEIKKNVALRDQHGNGYKPLLEVPEDLRVLLNYMKPAFKNMMGNFGEGLQFVVFPVKDAGGNIFADAHKNSEIFLDVTDLMGPPTSTYSWRFPITALSPPKYCPAGKEKVEANWKYCPWHGIKLIEDVSAVSTSGEAKP